MKRITDCLRKRLSLAFSLIELMISLIAISLITAAMAPVITKKLSNNTITVINTSSTGENGGVDESNGCEPCDAGYFAGKIAGECACIACKKSIDHCKLCSSSIICTECEENFTLQNKNMCMPNLPVYYTFTNLEGKDVKETSTILIEEGDTWKLKILESGYLTFDGIFSLADVFIVGGGGGGNSNSGGGGGYTKTETNVAIYPYTTYPITVGLGGAIGKNGGTTIAFGNMTRGGTAGGSVNGGSGGSGGGAGGNNTYAGGKNGANGANGNYWSAEWQQTLKCYGGKGQGTTTKEFGEETGTLYSSGSVSNPSANTGHGGSKSAGASGIVVIRGKKALKTTGACKLINCKTCEKSDYICDACEIGYEIKNGMCYTNDSINYTFTNSSGNDIKGTSTILSYNGDYWKLKILKSGNLKFTKLPNATVDLFLVGSGGKGSSGGGGGGYTKTKKNQTIEVDTIYELTIGGFTSEGNTIGFGFTANKGGNNSDVNGGAGGSGGGAGGNNAYAGGKDGANGANGSYWSSQWQQTLTSNGGKGQGTSTREFGETTGVLYSTGGNGANIGPGTANYGTGNGGSNGSGGTGIIVIRGKL